MGAPATASTPGAKAGPEARIAAHAAKKKSKDNRRAGSPGPGAYSPQLSTLKKGGTQAGSSFKSATKRGVDRNLGAQESGDPGSYDPYTLKELASTSKKSFAKSNRSGQGDFGGKAKRELNIEIMGEATPGPGAYTGDKMLRSGKKAALAAMDTGEMMPSSAFKSTTSKAMPYPNLHVPGAGAYTPMMTAIEPAPANPAMQMRAKGKRFESIKQVTDDTVGPGSYESHLEDSLQVSVAKAASKASRANPGFGTLTLAHDLPFLDAVQDAMDDPGPGAYENNKSTLNTSSSGARSSFKSGSQRGLKELSAQESGDPGSYDPYTSTDLASTSKKSFGKSNRVGMGNFGGMDKRELKVEVMGESTPGPGAYNGDVMMRNGKVAALAALDTGEKMPMSSFKSTTAKDIPYENLHVPGPGAYSAKFEHLMDSRMMSNSGASMRGKGARFQGAGKLARDQDAEPGPGAYETEILRTGGRSNLSAWDTGELMPSAAFASDSIREMPWPSDGGIMPKAASS